MMFLDLVSELEKKHDIFDKHCYDNRQVYSLKSIADLQQAQQPKSDVVYFTYVHMICLLCTIENCLGI